VKEGFGQKRELKKRKWESGRRQFFDPLASLVGHDGGRREGLFTAISAEHGGRRQSGNYGDKIAQKKSW
jgi:hypothetical protein